MTGDPRDKDRTLFDTEVADDGHGAAQPVLRHGPQVRWTDARGAHVHTVHDRVVLGSSAGVDLPIADPMVSRLHAELEMRDDGLWIRDLDSRNGTFLEGLRVSGARVPDRGRIRLGATELVVGYVSAPTLVDLWPDERFGPLLGRSVAMRELFARIARVAASDATVLIQGETGTGKELVARAIHEASPRAQGPWVIVDCGALPEHLLESELFGHVKGAFTGAGEARAGAIEVAHGGTVFLDEIGELPLSMQPKLLRAIESRTVRRLGEARHRDVDVRFVSATHRDLRRMVNVEAFREDLFFRLAVLPIRVPPLRARGEDIAMLVQHFLRPGASLAPALLATLSSRPWLGNVRELRNFVEQAVTLGAGEALASLTAAPSRPGRTDDELPAVPLDVPFKDLRERWLEHLEREYIRGLLAHHDHNVSAVAQAAGLTRAYVHRLVRKYDL